jgi:hypothetical protein
MLANFCLTSTFSGIDLVNTKQTDALHVFPNPTSDKLYVELPKQNNNGIFVIYNVSGQEVYRERCSVDNPVLTVNTSSFVPGVYIIKLMSDQGVSVGKFIKE